MAPLAARRRLAASAFLAAAAAAGLFPAALGVRIRSRETFGLTAVGAKPFGEAGPALAHVRQGQLGDCYFLAGIAAVAHRHPDIIKKLFVDEALWSGEAGRPAFTMKFLINGAEAAVVVDDVLPVLGSGRRFAFARAEDGESVWPLLMEKGFAKMFGSYMKIVAGRVYDSFKAVTQAPVDLLDIDELGEAGFWRALADAERNNFAMSGSSRNANQIGTTTGHQFVILATSEDYEGQGRAIQVYNPWNKNSYTGALSRDQTKGAYWMRYDEFMHAFGDVTVARIQPGYQISSTQVRTGTPTLLHFTMATDEPFAVQLEWPTSRFLPKGCDLGKQAFQFFVARAGDLAGTKFGTVAPYSHISNARADLPGGAGDYLVYVYAEFGAAPWLSDVVVNTYSAERVTWETRNTMVEQTARQMMGFDCEDLEWTDSQGESMWFTRRDLFRGSPAWKRLTGDAVLWLKDGKWQISVSASQPNRVWTAFKGPSELRCVRPHPRLDCDEVLWIGEDGSKERFRRRGPVQGSPAWKHVSRDDMILWFAGERKYSVIASETEPGRFYPSFKGPSQLQCAPPVPRFDGCEHLVWTTADGYKQRFTRRQPLQGFPAWKSATKSDVLWFAHEAEYKVIPSEADTNSFYPSFEGPSQLKCVDEEVARFSCSRLRWSSGRGRGYDFVRRSSPFLGSPAWTEIRRDGTPGDMVMWFNSEWQLSPSESSSGSYIPSFKPEQVQCLQSSFVEAAASYDHGGGVEPSVAVVGPSALVRRLARSGGKREELRSSSFAGLSQSSQAVGNWSSSPLDSWSSLSDSWMSPTEPVSREGHHESHERCSQFLERLARVNAQSGLELVGSSEDPLFPPTPSSIAAADDECKDEYERPTSCDQFAWARIPETLEKAAEVGRCIAAQLRDGKCYLRNMCHTSIKLDWLDRALDGDAGRTTVSFTDADRTCVTKLPEGSFKIWAEGVQMQPGGVQMQSGEADDPWGYDSWGETW